MPVTLQNKAFARGWEACGELDSDQKIAGARISCAPFRQAINMQTLSPNDDSDRRVSARRHREEGVANKSNNVFNKKKK